MDVTCQCDVAPSSNHLAKGNNSNDVYDWLRYCTCGNNTEINVVIVHQSTNFELSH